MRIANQKFTVRSIVFSKAAGFLYLLIAIFFVYKSLLLANIWVATKEKSKEAQRLYEKKILSNQQAQEKQENQTTTLGKERYQKDFFNKLDDGEHLIILYSEQKKEEQENFNEIRKMFWWDEMKQNFLVWWRNR
jgi:predicted membrane protein